MSRILLVPLIQQLIRNTADDPLGATITAGTSPPAAGTSPPAAGISPPAAGTTQPKAGSGVTQAVQPGDDSDID